MQLCLADLRVSKSLWNYFISFELSQLQRIQLKLSRRVCVTQVRSPDLHGKMEVQCGKMECNTIPITSNSPHIEQLPCDMQTPDWWEIVDGPALSFQLVCFHPMQYMKLVEAETGGRLPLPLTTCDSHQNCPSFWNKKSPCYRVIVELWFQELCWTGLKLVELGRPTTRSS